MPLFSSGQDTELLNKNGSYAVTERADVSRSGWNGWVEGSAGGGHFLQSYEWGEFKRHRHWKPVRLTLEKDGAVVGTGQFLVRRRLPVPGALMFCPKGPWLPWDDEAAVRTFFQGVRAAAGREGAHTVKIEPEVPEQQKQVKNLLEDMGFEKFRWDLHAKTTIGVDLTPPEEEILAGMKSKTRYNVRLAGRKGVRVVRDNSPEALESFYEMTRLMSERKGMWQRSREYLLTSWKTMCETGRAQLFFAEHEGDRLAGAIVPILGRKCWYLGGASIEKKRNLMPPYLLHWEIMRWAKRQGATYYDMFGIPSPDELDENHPWYGIYRFKAGFGGEATEFVGCLDLPVKSVRARLWNRMEPVYYRLYQRLKQDIYY